jgi:hypothetical protein
MASLSRAEPAREAAPSLLHEFFVQSARLHPDAPALVIPSGEGRARVEWSYRELDQRSQVLARALQPLVQPDELVAIRIARENPELYLTQLAARRGRLRQHRPVAAAGLRTASGQRQRHAAHPDRRGRLCDRCHARTGAAGRGAGVQGRACARGTGPSGATGLFDLHFRHDRQAQGGADRAPLDRQPRRLRSDGVRSGPR